MASSASKPEKRYLKRVPSQLAASQMTPLGPIVQSSDEVLNDSSEVVPYEKLMLAPLITPVRLDVRSTKKVYSKTNVEKQPHHATA